MFIERKNLLSRLKGKFAIFLVAVLVLQILWFCFASTPVFKDVPQTYWAYNEIEEAFADGVINGTSYDEATGTRYFSPENTLTLAHFMAIMVRAYYQEEIDTFPATRDTWYGKEETVAWKHNLLSGVNSDNTLHKTLQKNVLTEAEFNTIYSGTIRRIDMAFFIKNLLNDLGMPAITDEQMAEVSKQINDWSRILGTSLQKAVATVYYYGIIQGTSEGNFDMYSGVKRSHVGAIYSRLKKVVKEQLGITAGEAKTDTSGAVGTISDKPVTLNLATHYGKVYDYWSEQTAEIQNATNKDAFNAAVQTLKDYKIIWATGTINMVGSMYYNYAVFPTISAGNLKEALVNLKVNNGGFVVVSPYLCDYMYVDTYGGQNNGTKKTDAMEPILAQLDDNMTDYEKAEILVKGITDKFDYGSGSFSWGGTTTTGKCESFAVVTLNLFSAAGIPVIELGGKMKNGLHSWNEAYLDGEWYVIDSTFNETGRSFKSDGTLRQGVWTIDEYESEYDTNHMSSETTWIKITKALVSAAGW